MPESRWSSRLSKPLVLRNGKILRTLSDARAHILKLSRGEQERQTWAKATELLIDAAENDGDIPAATNAINFALFLSANLRLE